jgi:hypothetical protein
MPVPSTGMTNGGVSCFIANMYRINPVIDDALLLRP